MIIVDDRLTLDVLAGRRAALGATPDDVVATTWSFHYRLVRALSDPTRTGRLSSGPPSAELIAAVVAPNPAELQVLDPRTVTSAAAAVAVRHGLNLLAAELVASAAHHGAAVALSAANVGRTWPGVFAAEGLELRVVA